jgi:hypothetical protein
MTKLKTEALFLFLILLAGLVACSFFPSVLSSLGMREGFKGKFSGTFFTQDQDDDQAPHQANTGDHYNHYDKQSTQLNSGSIYYGPNGTSAKVITNSDGSQSLQIVLPNSSSPVQFTSSKPGSTQEGYTNFSINTYHGPNGGKATVVRTNNGQQAIKVKTATGTYYYYNEMPMSSTQYYGSTGTSIQPTYNEVQPSAAATGTSAGAITGPNGNSAFYAQGPQGNAVVGTATQNDYSSTLPPGIPRSQIPPGQEDLYILKSEVVPPVCPACPVNMTTVEREEKCPPCPACARCPEPSFECKKVPNYNAINNDYLPMPVLSDFSQFGM